jgi:hypothetical protein
MLYEILKNFFSVACVVILIYYGYVFIKTKKKK